MEKKQKPQYILLTYRQGIKKQLQQTYYNSDTGWGCMLRVAQMSIANLLLKIGFKPISIISLFHDNTPNFFSIQDFTQVSHKLMPHKKQFQWFSPCQVGFIIKQLLNRKFYNIQVQIFNDNSVFLDQIKSDKQNLLIMLMCRIGLQKPQNQYLKNIIQIMNCKYFLNIMGGTPKRAHLFLQYDKKKGFGYLDPHKTRKVFPIQQLQQHVQQYIKNKLQWIKQKQIDCSMGISFLVPKLQIQNFKNFLIKLKQQKQLFLYIDYQRPIFDQDFQGIIQLDISDQQK